MCIRDMVIAYRLDGRSGALAVVVNLGASGVELPGGSTLLVASDPLVAGRLPTCLLYTSRCV